MADERVQRKLAAILAADVVGFSRMMGEDEAGTLAQLKTLRRELFEPKIAQFDGRIFKNTGDGALAEFGSANDAVQSAVEIQKALVRRNADVPEDRRIILRIGISLGDVIVDGDDLYGNGVNVAARMEGLAQPGGICVSGNVHEHLGTALDVTFEDLGEQAVKNIDRPVRSYRVHLEPAAVNPIVEQRDTPPALPDKPSIAVLPFENMSGDVEQEYFADGIAEDIITSLSHTHWLFVVARNSSFTYKGSAVDVKRVSEELGVGYVLEGSVRKAGIRVRITAQLINAATGNHIWAERFDRDLEDIFAVQDEITESVVAAIGPELMVAETQRAQRKPPQSLDAWDYLLRALSHIWRLNEEDMREAKDLLLRAVEIDPGYAQAHSMLGWTYIHHAWMAWGDKPEELIPLAREAARTAVALDEQEPWGHVVLGRVHAYARDHESAVAELEKAIEFNPNLPIARGMLGLILAYGGRSEQAIAELDRAIRANPRDPFNVFYYGPYSVAHYLAGRYEEAARWARQGVQQRPDGPGCHRMEAISCAKLGQFEQARVALDRAKRLQPGLSLAWAEAYAPYARPEDLKHYIDGFREAGLTE
jgi:TolB-like protein/cytochrome c-type biogenesis protein CcmH/NrfG